MLTISFSSCHIARFFYYNYADVKDYKKFPQSAIKTSSIPFEFYTTDQNKNIQLPASFIEEGMADFDQFNLEHKTLSFIIIRNDSILYENYFDGYDDSSIIPSFSVSKAFVSALAGIAIDNGKIKCVNDSITTYIPELQHKGLEKITVEHLLNMRSGLDFVEGYNSPFSDMAKYYYGLNLKKYISELKLKEEPGSRYEYLSVNSELLALAIENAWGKPLPTLLEEQLWQPMGMEFDASWSLDSQKNQTVKAFCCINARARDFAKFGRLYLNKGDWQGKQLVSKDWVEKSLLISNNSSDSQGYNYHYNWRVLRSGAFFAKGILGQYIYVNPTKKIIIVRMGKSTANVHWPKFFEELCRGL